MSADTSSDTGARAEPAAPGSAPAVRVLPTSTYRLQLHAGWGFDEAAAAVPQLAALGISHLYLSPVLQAVPGSMHGYDVLDHRRLSADLGGAPAFARLAARAHEHGLGIVVDVVPNHMARPTPESANAPFWSLLSEGRESAFAGWFDVDWEAGGGRVLLPVLGSPLREVLANDELHLDGDVLRYYDHEFPVRAGTAGLPLAELVDAQHYRLAWWKTAATELNYRRFFDVDSLVAIRVEDPAVFGATHAVLLEHYRDGSIDGFRIDHPDGLADPADYLHQLAVATGGAWVVAEKILEDGEELPADWACTGTTGYDALNLVQALFVDPRGKEPLLEDWVRLSGDDRSSEEVIASSKRQVATTVLDAEVERLTRIAAAEADSERRDLAAPRLKAAIVELLLGMEVYRGYAGTSQGARVVAEAAQRASAAAPDLGVELAFVQGLAVVTDGQDAASAGHREFTARFGQTAGPVMAKGIEDTAFYRWFPLSCLTEVGGNASRFGLSADEFHAWCARTAATRPAGMTTLSTHDTKRSEDTRARLVVLAEHAHAWVDLVAKVRDASAGYRPARLDGATESLIWQTLYAVSPWGGQGAVHTDRLHAYLQKAIREAKVHTTWTAPDESYEDAVREFLDAVLADDAVLKEIGSFADADLGAGVRAVTLGQKLVQLTMPGIPDVYQGTEVVSRTLVDPDNRDDVDHAGIGALLAALDGDPERTTGTGRAADLDAEKLLVVSRALRLRRQRPEVFAGSYAPLTTGTPHAVGYLRGGEVAVVAARFVTQLPEEGFGDAHLGLPAGTWADALTGSAVHAAADGVLLAEVLGRLPVALLVRRGVVVTLFEVWAPAAEKQVSLQVDGATVAMARSAGGWWRVEVPEAAAGSRYAFALDGGEPRPDPRSLWQPDGVNAASAVFDVGALEWTDGAWHGVARSEAIAYELHVGTFTPEGTLDAAIGRLPHLVELGITLVELLPLADFDGPRGWGYDGVALWAVHGAYGGPAALARFVDAAHAHGLGVCVDAVYNHLGPSGNYLSEFGPYFTDTHHTPWGAAVNLDAPESDEVRAFLLGSAMSWLRDFHVDVLRLDAVHALVDTRALPWLEELSTAVDGLAAATNRSVWLVAESDQNDPRTTEARYPVGAGGLGLHAQWDDDIHHSLFALLTGESSGYYGDFAVDAAAAYAKVATRVFFHDGTYSTFRGRVHGREVDTASVSASRFWGFLNNHDQIGNRAVGDRMSTAVPAGVLAAGAALLLTGPFTPMLFMGEEWGARTPFQYFTSFPDAELGRAVSQGRRGEFASHGWDVDDIPDPQAESTFLDSKLDWSELDEPDHRVLLDWYRGLIALRRAEPGLRDGDLSGVGMATGPDGSWVTQQRGDLLTVAALQPGPVDLPRAVPGSPSRPPEVVLAFGDPVLTAGALSFDGPGAAVLRLR